MQVASGNALRKKERKNKMEKEMTIDISAEFQSKLLDILQWCADNRTDTTVLTMDYPQATIEVELTFNIIRK